MDFFFFYLFDGEKKIKVSRIYGDEKKKKINNFKKSVYTIVYILVTNKIVKRISNLTLFKCKAIFFFSNLK